MYKTVFATLAALAAATPIADIVTFNNETDALVSRQPGGVDLCTDINFSGTCGYAKQPFDSCIQLDAPYYHTISSIGPDKGNAIVFSEDRNCAGNAYTIFYPGSKDLRNEGWNDRIGSFRVRQIPGDSCINSVDNKRLPGVNCQRCCNNCQRSGQDCCPDGQIC